MTTIKLIPSTIEFDVSIDSASMPGLFDQSLETTICAKIDEHVTNRIPDAENISDALQSNRDFLRRVRDWVIESMDTGDIARQVGDQIDIAEVIDSLGLTNESIAENNQFMRKLTDSPRFHNAVYNSVTRLHDDMNMRDIINEKIESMSISIANDVAEKVMTMIANKISNTDV